jgi:hypothetical protein
LPQKREGGILRSEYQAGYRQSLVPNHLIYQTGFPNKFLDWMRRITRERAGDTGTGGKKCLNLLSKNIENISFLIFQDMMRDGLLNREMGG